MGRPFFYSQVGILPGHCHCTWRIWKLDFEVGFEHLDLSACMNKYCIEQNKLEDSDILIWIFFAAHKIFYNFFEYLRRLWTGN